MSSVAALASTAVQMQSAAFGQQVAVALARKQNDAQKAVLALVAGSAPPPAGQGRLVDVRA